MSAYVCHADTFDYLATFAKTTTWHSLPYSFRQQSKLGYADPQEIGACLFAENVRSVNARYSLSDDQGGYVYRPVNSGIIDPVRVIKSCDCLNYQSCETDDWRDTVAYALLQYIREKAIRALMGGNRYNDAGWGWTREEQVHIESAARDGIRTAMGVSR